MSGKLLVPMRMIMIPNISRNTFGPRLEEADPAGAEEDLEGYRAECRAVDAALEGAKLDDTFTVREKTTSVRWMWQHLVEEYARHNGHADLLS